MLEPPSWMPKMNYRLNHSVAKNNWVSLWKEIQIFATSKFCMTYIQTRQFWILWEKVTTFWVHEKPPSNTRSMFKFRHQLTKWIIICQFTNFQVVWLKWIAVRQRLTQQWVLWNMVTNQSKTLQIVKKSNLIWPRTKNHSSIKGLKVWIRLQILKIKLKMTHFRQRI